MANWGLAPLAFDMHVVGPWEGETLDITADDAPVVTTSFSNGSAQQYFPGAVGDPLQPAQTAALAVNTVDVGGCDVPDAIYHQGYTFAHDTSTLQLQLSVPALPVGAGWAIDDVFVVASSTGDPWEPSCTPQWSRHRRRQSLHRRLLRCLQRRTARPGRSRHDLLRWRRLQRHRSLQPERNLCAHCARPRRRQSLHCRLL